MENAHFQHKNIDFLLSMVYNLLKLISIFQGRDDNMNKSLLVVLISVIGGVAAITAAVTAFLIIREKQRRDEEELEHYLDSSIQ